ncbi:MAG TPA: tetratricopeptide repeat protein, partial [Candidatus Nitrosotenuis sp.]|nr:tetratricopeptide repeat protein [Candidatus Nitrosotenuis sp.]
IPLFKRATELDPNFALAYARLGTIYNNSGEFEQASLYQTKAFELRDRVSELERFYITCHFYNDILSDLPKARDAYELWEKTYPRHSTPPVNLGRIYLALGQPEKALEKARRAQELDADSVWPLYLFVDTYIAMSRFEEAKTFNQRLLAKSPDSFIPHNNSYLLAYVEGDRAAMDQEVASLRRKPGEEVIVASQSFAAAMEGRMRSAREISKQAVELGQRAGFKESAAWVQLSIAFADAIYGNHAAAKQRMSEALSHARSRNTEGQAVFVMNLTGDFARAQQLTDDLTKRFPQDTIWNEIIVPAMRASKELQRKNPAKALEALRPAEPYMTVPAHGVHLLALYFRAQAHLALRHPKEATADFQKILDNRGVDIFSVLQPLSRVGLARAAALDGDTAKARKFYQDFFALWKDADADIHILQEVKAEYAKLK